MSKIKITLPAGEVPSHGKHISFPAPCDCTDASAIIIDGIEYTLVDAAGNSICNIGNAFCSGSLLTVLLDMNNNKAYLQNGSAMPVSGGTFTGPVTLGGIILTPGVDFFDEEPDTSTLRVNQLIFIKDPVV